VNKILDKLNDPQKQAVLSEDKHVLILAGAGTGKTRAITSRIIYLIKEKGIPASQILAVTFTNKAAREMKNRVQKELSKYTDVMIRTFHSFGAYVLRNEAFAAGRDRFFHIYDDDESKKALNEIIKKYEYAKKEIKYVRHWIETFKQQVEDISGMDYKDEEYKKIYDHYNKFLLDSNCFDFGDLILEPVRIFKKYPELLKKYRDRFKYILIDEYQDTNKVQFELAKLLAGKKNNIMAVGDEDQSIYSFRGADINNILNFEKDFDSTSIIRMEENYRSTSNILTTANELISKNNFRLGKELYTNFDKGNKIKILNTNNEGDEAQKIIDHIIENKFKLDDTAILYRTNNQSRPFEQILNRTKLPYVIIGAIRFFDREEIKDSLSILKWLVNPKDKISFARFINKPTRGIGQKSVELFFEESKKYDNDLYQTLEKTNSIKGLSTKVKDTFTKIFEIFIDKESHIKNESVDSMLNYYLHQLKLLEYFENKDEVEGTEKLNNIVELIKSIQTRGKGIDNIQMYLEEVSLTSSMTNEDYENKLKILTIHNAKGLEFENVFISGIEEGLFPHSNSLDSDEEYEEERRLFYVAITRAKKNLILSYCNWRTMAGWQKYQAPSPFLDELPVELLELNFNDKNGIYKNADVSETGFSEGDVVRHIEYGKGKILLIKMDQGRHLAKIDFWDHSLMDMILEYSKLEKVID